MSTCLLLAILLLASGCSFFSRSKSRIFSLDRVPPAAPIVAATGLPVGINSLELPPGFDRKEIVVRQAGQQLEVRSTDQWSASLAPLALHTLAADVADRLPVGMVVLPGQTKPPGLMRTVDVAVEELAPGPDAKLVLDARWTIHEPGRPDVAHRDRLETALPSLDSANIASGTAQVLGALADRIAAALAQGPSAR